MMNEKLRGYFSYYGVIGNSNGINEFYNEAMKILYKWLNRRSQRKSFTWEEFNKKMKRYEPITPRITERLDNQMRFEECFVKNTEVSIFEEPGAVVPHAGNCAGVAE